jgi:pantetheine-phosphate adenylyltransferase
MATIAIYPGTFDPFTLGHLDIAKRVQKMFPKLIILVASNPNKRPRFSASERKEMISEVLCHKVQVEHFNGLLIEYVKQLRRNQWVQPEDVPVLVRGLRAMSDFENEFQMAHVNKQLNDEVETIFVPTCAEHFFVSSSTVKEIASFGGDVSKFVPDIVYEKMTGKKKPIPGVVVHDTASWCSTCNPGLKKERP